MKKILLLFLFSTFFVTQAQILSEEFEDITTLESDGWTRTNQSEPFGSNEWFQGLVDTAFPAYSGEGYIAVNFHSASGSGIISNWLISPVVTLNNGDVISFYTRNPDETEFADNLELRLSTNGSDSADPSGPTDVGDYTILAVTVNEIFPDVSGYPSVWTEYTYEISGLSGATDCRVAFRYTIPENGGPNGDYGSYIGIDKFVISSGTNSVDDLEALGFSYYPNPVKDIFNLKADVAIDRISIINLLGQEVYKSKPNALQQTLDFSDLEAGIYMLRVSIDGSEGTFKIVKK